MNILNSVPASSVLVYSMLFPPTEMVVQADKRVFEEQVIISGMANGIIPSRKEIKKIQDTIMSWPDYMGEDQAMIFHSFADGMYTREMHAPKGLLLVGKIHRNDHIVNLLKGKLLVMDEHSVKEIEAPCSFVSKAGAKRVGFFLEDTVWQDIHRTDATTIEEAEKEIFVDDYSDMEIEVTYKEAIAELGYTEDEVQVASEQTEDIIPLPSEYLDNVDIKDSEIDGLGVFALKSFYAGDIIAPARYGNNRTPIGRYTNHASIPNAKSIQQGDVWYCVACKDIDIGDEITVDYRQVRSTVENRGVE